MWTPAIPDDAMRDLRPSRLIDDEDPGAVGVATERVVPAVSLGREWSEPPKPRGVEIGRLRAALPQLLSRRADLSIALSVGLVALVASDDPRIGAAGAAVVALAAVVRFIDRHVSFSFGEGFVGYRGDPAWPRGVQEDDDVRWDWRPRTANG
jgi:hypothetical protein